MKFPHGKWVLLQALVCTKTQVQLYKYLICNMKDETFTLHLTCYCLSKYSKGFTLETRVLTNAYRLPICKELKENVADPTHCFHKQPCLEDKQ